MLYESLTGKKPYERDSDVAVMFAHITEPPPKVSDVRPELPEALDAVIAKAMAKAPGDRYETCRAMIEAARAALGGPDHGRRGGRGPGRGGRGGGAGLHSNLPALATPLVGRDAELAAVSRAPWRGQASGS